MTMRSVLYPLGIKSRSANRGTQFSVNNDVVFLWGTIIPEGSSFAAPRSMNGGTAPLVTSCQLRWGQCQRRVLTLLRPSNASAPAGQLRHPFKWRTPRCCALLLLHKIRWVYSRQSQGFMSCSEGLDGGHKGIVEGRDLWVVVVPYVGFRPRLIHMDD